MSWMPKNDFLVGLTKRTSSLLNREIVGEFFLWYGMAWHGMAWYVIDNDLRERAVTSIYSVYICVVIHFLLLSSLHPLPLARCFNFN